MILKTGVYQYPPRSHAIMLPYLKSRGITAKSFWHKIRHPVGSEYDVDGLEVRDRQGRYGVLRGDDLNSVWHGKSNKQSALDHLTPLELIAELMEQGLDVRLTRDLKPSKRQLSFQF